MLLVIVWIKTFLDDFQINASSVRLIFTLVNFAIEFYGAPHSSVVTEWGVYFCEGFWLNVHSACKSLKILSLERKQCNGLLHSARERQRGEGDEGQRLVIYPCHPFRSVVFNWFLIQEPDLTLVVDQTLTFIHVTINIISFTYKIISMTYCRLNS